MSRSISRFGHGKLSDSLGVDDPNPFGEFMCSPYPDRPGDKVDGAPKTVLGVSGYEPKPG